MKHPRQYPKKDYQDLASVVDRGQYLQFRKKEAVPNPLRSIVDYPPPENFQRALIMASVTSDKPQKVGQICPASSTPIYRAITIRADVHGQSEPHLNRDDILIFSDIKGNTFQLAPTDKSTKTDHFVRLSESSGLGAALNIYNLPEQDSGSIDTLKKLGVVIDFSTDVQKQRK